MSKSTRSYDHSPDWKFGTRIPVHTRNTVEMGTVLHGFGKLKPVPVYTHDTLSWVYLYPCHSLVVMHSFCQNQNALGCHGLGCKGVHGHVNRAGLRVGG